MNTPAFSSSDSSARRRVIAALVILLLAPPLLYFSFLRPIEEERRRTVAEARQLSAELDRYAERYRHMPVEVLLDHERAAMERLQAEYDRIDARARTLREGLTLSDVLASGVEGRIDFKVALFEARDRLGRIAAEKGVQLPADLGISETIASAEQAQIRLWQLASTVLLLERCIETGIREIVQVEPLDPISLPVRSPAEWPGMIAYPVNIRFTGSYGRFVALLRALGDEQRGFFALRSFWVRYPRPKKPEALDCRVVTLALRAAPPPAPEPALKEEPIPDPWERESAILPPEKERP